MSAYPSERRITRPMIFGDTWYTDHFQTLEAGLDSQELTRILTLMKPGMVLTVPDEWLDAAMRGSPVQKANRIAALASEFCCVHKHGIGFQTFERVDYPRCG